MKRTEWVVERLWPDKKYYPIKHKKKLITRRPYVIIYGDGFYNFKICKQLVRKLNNKTFKLKWKDKRKNMRWNYYTYRMGD